MQGWKGFQFAHFVRPTDIFFPKLWSNASLALGGAWIPSYWVRSRFEPADPVAAAFKFGLSVSHSSALPSVMTARHCNANAKHHVMTTSKEVLMWQCLWLCAVQLQALMRTIWVHAVPIIGAVMALIAIWSLLLSGVRSSY